MQVLIGKMIKIVFISLSLLMLQAVYAATNIVVGETRTFQPEFKIEPLIMINNQNDNTWKVVKQISDMPAGVKRATLSSVSCSNGFCIASGNYDKDNSDKGLLLLSSKDKGQSWTFIKNISGIPSYIREIEPYRIQCANGTCVAIGVARTHVETYPTDYPLLMTSSDNGQSWTFSNAGWVNLMGRRDGNLYSITHSGNTWLVSGYYDYYPFPWVTHYQAQLVLRSQDNGLSWEEISVSGSALPAPGMVDSVKCYGNTCFAVGLSSDRSYPLIGISDDTGRTWRAIQNFTGMPASASQLFLGTITCKDNTCISAETVNWSDITPFILLTSNNRGLSWTQSQNIQGISPSLEKGSITDINCIDRNNCIAIGSMKNNTVNPPVFPPILLNSHDGGYSWSNNENITGTPDNLKEMHFGSLSCADSNCIIVGNWYTDAYVTQFPLILMSQDKGQSWKFTQEIEDFSSDVNLVSLRALASS